jgi:hypothetical protein
MPPVPPPVPTAEHELSVEEVASRMGVPVALLIRRIEAGDVPARKIETLDGSAAYRLRPSDLGDMASQLTFDDDSAEQQSGGDTDTVLAPARSSVEMTRLDESDLAPVARLMSAAIDPRELVAGLLDRWERTLEQRIHAEQRQRFESELTARQSQIRHLQLELEAVRAQQAASIADRERVIAENQHAIAERESELVALRASIRQRPRGWLFRRY